jgi:hypothetical protein
MSSLNTENLEDNHTESAVKRTEIALGYYKHLLEVKRTTAEDSSFMPESCVMPAVPNNVPYIGTPMSSEFSYADSESHITGCYGSNWSFDSPAQPYISTYPEPFTSHGFASSYSAPFQASEPLYFPSPGPAEPMNANSFKNLVPVTTNFQHVGGLSAGSAGEIGGLETVDWAEDDSLTVPLQAQACFHLHKSHSMLL